MVELNKCFFCDKIIIPFKYVSMQEVQDFYKKYNLEFSLNHERSRLKIGKKIVCLRCEEDIREITQNVKHECEECKKERELENRKVGD